MIGAVLDTRRRALGLSVAETAALFGVEDRVVNRWIDDRKVPDDPAGLLQRLDDLEAAMDGVVGGIVTAACDAVSSGPVRLLRFASKAQLDAAMREIGGANLLLPLGAHAMLIAWADDQLAAQGIDTVIAWAA